MKQMKAFALVQSLGLSLSILATFALGTCPPGTFVSISGTCQTCPDGSYAKENNSEKCTRCDECPGKHSFIALPCNKTSNTKCGCEDGYFYGELLICVKCQLCKRGRGVVKNCTASSDTVCGLCEKGKTFSSAKDVKPCTPCDLCAKGYIVQSECSRRYNTKCISEKEKNTSRMRPLKTTLRPITSAGKSDTPPITPTTSTSSKTSDFVTSTTTTTSTISPNHESGLKYVLLGAGSVFGVLIVVVLFFGIRHHRRRKRLRRHPAAAKTRDRSDATSESSLSTTDGMTLQENRGSLVPLMAAQKDKPLRSTSCTLVQELSQHINPHGRWKDLAGRLGFSLLQINNFALEPVTATEKILTEWGHREGATLLALHNIFTQLKWKHEAKIVTKYM